MVRGRYKSSKSRFKRRNLLLALKGNPLVVRTMDAGDLEAVFKEYQKR